MRPRSFPCPGAVSVAGWGVCASWPLSDFYPLAPRARRGRPPAATPVTVLIGVVTVPDLVDRPQIVVRSGDNKVEIDEFARWADPLKTQIPNVVRADLARLLGSAFVSTRPMAGDPASAYRVQLDVQRFDGTLGDAATVDVLWSVSPPGKGSPRSGRSTVQEHCAGAGYDALVAAYSRALVTVSRDISASIRP
uniref:ABC-type transport auxiliary lipoprotein component domain-containing protein n=1 Tax=Paraburkholderia madseniana TaxID=2599607 RepID=A0A6N6VZT2_9BURK|nr:PqiC family protein [Paraburkholderia madseniana]KAE8753611.1 hypothetical protein FSO04_44140 [Paraburkholderia madseniana]